MKASIFASLMLAALLTAGISGTARADDDTVMITSDDPADLPGHPRIEEIEQRLERQVERVEAGVTHGQINANQATRDLARDTKVAGQLTADVAANNGHITKAEQNQMNRELNRNSARIYNQRHK